MNPQNQKLNKFLALDTAGNTIHAALQLDGEISILSANRAESKTRNIAVLTSELLEQTKLPAAELRGVIIAIGPGSFTGLRVGLSFAKGIAAVGETPLIGVTRFEQALNQLQESANAGADSMFIRMKQGAYYRYRASASKESQIDVVTIAEIEKQYLASENRTSYFIDCEIPEFSAAYQTSETSAENIGTINSNPEALFAVALHKQNQEQPMHWTKLEPLYVQRSEAEIQAQSRQEKKNSL